MSDRTRRSRPTGNGRLLRLVCDDDTEGTSTQLVGQDFDDVAKAAHNLAEVLAEAQRRPELLDSALRDSLARAARRIERDLERCATA